MEKLDSKKIGYALISSTARKISSDWPSYYKNNLGVLIYPTVDEATVQYEFMIGVLAAIVHALPNVFKNDQAAVIRNQIETELTANSPASGKILLAYADLLREGEKIGERADETIANCLLGRWKVKDVKSSSLTMIAVMSAVSDFFPNLRQLESIIDWG